MGAESKAIAATILRIIGNHVQKTRAGHLFGSDVGYQCFSGTPTKVRRADVSLIRKGRFPNERVPKGYVSIPPDLVVEVNSPNDLAEEVNEKVEDYLSAKVTLIWVVSPATRTVNVFGDTASFEHGLIKLSGDDRISGVGVLPGFECKVSDFFATV